MAEEVKTHRLIFKFGAEWCVPCKKISIPFEGLEAKYPKVSVIEMDLDANKDIADQYEIKSVPAFVPFYRGKVLRKYIYSGSDLGKIEGIFKYLMNKHEVSTDKLTINSNKVKKTTKAYTAADADK